MKTRVSMLACLILLLAACSTVKLLYDRLDWLLPRYLGNYVNLNSEQRAQLDANLAELLRWHRQTQLPRYAAWLRELQGDLDRGLSRADLERHEQALEGFWRDLMLQTTPLVADLLADLSADQQEQLFETLAERNQRYQREYVDPAPLRVADRRAEQASDRLDYWLGRISPQQAAILRDWGRRYAPMGELNLAFREHWQRHLRSLTNAGSSSSTEFESALRTLLVEPESDRPEELKQARLRTRMLTQDLLLELDGTLTSGQRQHLRNRLDTLARDFEQLARR